jgi:hypothetical protein
MVDHRPSCLCTSFQRKTASLSTVTPAGRDRPPAHAVTGARAAAAAAPSGVWLWRLPGPGWRRRTVTPGHMRHRDGHGPAAAGRAGRATSARPAGRGLRAAAGGPRGRSRRASHVSRGRCRGRGRRATQPASGPGPARAGPPRRGLTHSDRRRASLAPAASGRRRRGGAGGPG